MTTEERSCFPDLVFVLLSLVPPSLQVIGVVFPGWWVVETPNSNGDIDGSYYGLWVTYTCENKTCFSTQSDRSGIKAWLQGVVILETLAAVLLPLGSVSLIFVLRRRDKGSLLRRFYVLLSGGSGVISIIGILVFIKKKAGLISGTAINTKDGEPGWPLILCSSAAGLAIILGLAMGICLMVVYNSKEDPDERESRLNYWLNKEKTLQELK